MKTPGSLYSKSNRKYYEGIIDFNYPGNFRERIVNDRGFINYNRKRHFIGNPFSCYKVGLEIKKTGEVKVYFGKFLLGKLDFESCLLIPENFNKITEEKTEKVLPMSWPKFVTYVLIPDTWWGNTYWSIDKAKKILGYNPKYNFKEFLQALSKDDFNYYPYANLPTWGVNS